MNRGANPHGPALASGRAQERSDDPFGRILGQDPADDPGLVIRMGGDHDQRVGRPPGRWHGAVALRRAESRPRPAWS